MRKSAATTSEAEQLISALRSVKPATLKFDPANARVHPDDNIEALKVSLERFGQPEPLIVQQSTMQVVAGNGRLTAMLALGWPRCQVRLVDWDDAKCREYSLTANRTGELSTWNLELLETQLEALKGMGVSLDNMGFNQDALDDLFAGNRGDADETTEDDVPDVPEKATTQPGDLWELGEHLLYCGDSRQAGELQAVMGRARADAVVTDPPYGVSYVGKTADALTIKNDWSEGLRQLLQDALTAAKGVCREGAAWYVAAPAGPQFLEFAQVLSDLEIWR
ncbi:MAG TPA: ParB N-terminal domain-containing protein, partial [Myxococcota bacterium]|nr:ParB N-terminal domain-containing protein [Myxococcota bacterium]